MRILLLNWRDIRSARGGGAERVTQEIGARLVERGHLVTWLSSSEQGLVDAEKIDGVHVVRRGSELTTRLYGRQLAHSGFDIVVDAINTLPYLTPLWSRIPSVVFFHQLARDVWWYEAPLPVAVVGWTLEPLYLRVYRDTPAIAVSPSTRDDLRRFGLRGRIDVIPLAVTPPRGPHDETKRLDGRLVAIGRLTPSKRFEHGIEALVELRRTHPAARLDILGTGAEHDKLLARARELGVEESVQLHGRVTDDERDRLIGEADAVIGTAVREGWGLTVTEGAIAGTPAVVYDINGFRDSVVDGKTGAITASTPAALADGVRRLIADRAAYEAIRESARERAAALSWDATTDAFEVALEAALTRSRG